MRADAHRQTLMPGGADGDICRGRRAGNWPLVVCPQMRPVPTDGFHPECAAFVEGDSPKTLVRHSWWQFVINESALAETMDRVAAPCPKPARVPKQGFVCQPGRIRRYLHKVCGGFLPAGATAARQYPYVTVIATCDSVHNVCRNSVLPAVRAESAIVVSHQPAVYAMQPQVATPALLHAAELVGK